MELIFTFKKKWKNLLEESLYFYQIKIIQKNLGETNLV